MFDLNLIKTISVLVYLDHKIIIRLHVIYERIKKVIYDFRNLKIMKPLLRQIEKSKKCATQNFRGF